MSQFMYRAQIVRPMLRAALAICDSRYHALKRWGAAREGKGKERKGDRLEVLDLLSSSSILRRSEQRGETKAEARSEMERKVMDGREG